MSVPLVHHVSSSDFDATAVLVIVCSTLGIYNALEIILLVFVTFKHYSGLYFWSLLIASSGVIPYTMGWLVLCFELAPMYAAFIINSYGWVTMVTGQSVVLYSRLHLVLHNENILRAVKWMIIVDAVVMQITTVVVLLGSNARDDRNPFSQAYRYIEKIQMTTFCLQEFIISGLYVWATIRLLRIMRKPGTKRVMWQLFIINTIIIIMDIALLALEYRDLRIVEQAIKVVIYSTKLKIEFAILGKLVELVLPDGRSLSIAMYETDSSSDDTKGTASTDLTMIGSNRRGTETSGRPYRLAELEEKDFQEEIAQHVGPDDAISRGRVNRTSESNLMYAEAMRSISQ